MNQYLRDKIKGFTFGAAIGDALGLGSELMTRQEYRHYYPQGLREYSQIIRDAHRAPFPRGSWTNDMEVIIMMIESLSAVKGIDYMDYARRLKEWYHTRPVEVLSHMRWVLSQPDYTEDPIKVCRRVWRNMRRFEAGNDAMGRSAVIGLWPGDHVDDAKDNCRLTHADARCVACSALIATTAHKLLYDNEVIDYNSAAKILSDIDDTTIPYLDIARDGTLDDFELDDEETYWYTRKTMGVAMWTLWHDKRPYETLTEIIDQAGDAGTNASLALAFSCMRYGIDDIPASLVEGLLGKERLDELSEQFADAVAEACGQQGVEI